MDFFPSMLEQLDCSRYQETALKPSYLRKTFMKSISTLVIECLSLDVVKKKPSIFDRFLRFSDGYQNFQSCTRW